MNHQSAPREQLGSRIGFLLLAAGCAIGLGNVWRFPYITGEYGGALFVAIYILFLVIFGLPLLIMEFAVGRASRKNMGAAFHELEPAGARWHHFGCLSLIGSYLLMMFYTVVAGWMFAYFLATANGTLSGKTPEEVGMFFGQMLADPWAMTGWLALTVVLGFVVCGMGLRNGVERVVKVIMGGLFIIMILLVVRSVTLPGGEDGIRFYLMPSMEKLTGNSIWTAINAAMGQAFFTLGLGIGSMAIFGSYIDKSRSLTGEALNIIILDTFVALMSGLIIFPACFAFGVSPDSGPGLIFVTLPNIFNNMPLGRFWGTLFFIFMACAAISTVIAVFENIVSYCMDVWGWSRRKASLVNCVTMFMLSLPCVLGFNLLADFQPLGKKSNILDLEDFLVSNNLLPIGALVFILFCGHKWGWGWNQFLHETDQGQGLKFPRWTRVYICYILPLAVFFLFVRGYIDKFFS